ILWGEQSPGEFKDLSAKAEKLSVIIVSWKQHTPQLLVPLAPSSGEIEFAVEKLHQELENFLKPLTFTDEGRELRRIFTDAVSFQADLALQTAWWYCDQPGLDRGSPPFGTTFNDVTMTAQMKDTNFAAGSVTLTISPALIKRGNSHGDDFSSERVVCQSEVLRGHS
ncbi:hypothetical protein QBC40DRAFT_327739, partial [Triangularia verruculosa]